MPMGTRVMVDQPPVPSCSIPGGLAVDQSGNLYIADGLNQRIREVSNGIIHTVVGTGTAGFSGDGGPPTNAQLTWTSGVAVEDNGNLYIADAGNKRIRVVSLAPTITTLSPVSAFVGGSAFTLTVTGTNFQTGSVVQWNGTPLSTTYVSATQLTTAVTASLIASVATASVTVANAQNVISNAVSFSIVAPFTVSSTPTSLTIASPGANATATVSITPATAFTGTVALTCTVAYKGTGTADKMTPTLFLERAISQHHISTLPPPPPPPPHTHTYIYIVANATMTVIATSAAQQASVSRPSSRGG